MGHKKAIRTKDGFRVTHINRRRACRLMCLECMGWDNADIQVNACDGKILDGSTCSLVSYKNMRGEQNAAERNKAIRAFCLECMGDSVHNVAICTSVHCPVYPYRNTITDKSTLFGFDVSDEIVIERTESNRRHGQFVSAKTSLEAKQSSNSVI